jgi:S1-C subfamily serine protease
MIKKVLIVISLNILFISCNKVIEPETPEKIFEKYKGSVVLIASQYYYEVHSGNSTYYYSPSSEKKLFLSKEEVLNNLSFSTGTGFVISEKGEIITNNHVVNHKDENYKSELVNFYEKAKSTILYDVRMYNDTIDQIKSTYNQYSDQMEYYEKENFEKRYDLVRDKKNFLVDLYQRIENIDLSNSTSKLIIHKLGIAYNDTHVTEFDDLQECVVVKTSENEKIDLALIQTKSKSFNTKPKFILNFKDNNPNILENPEKNKERNIKNPIKINEDVFMIGFNRGFSLANTKQGIKSQFTSGKISQENDGERILYTIPTLEGSSGSPIVDKWGNLIGVNFAKITNSQSFSFAVPVYELKKFYEE